MTDKIDDATAVQTLAPINDRHLPPKEIGHPATEIFSPAPPDFEEYESLPRPFWRLIFLFSPLIFGIPIAGHMGELTEHTARLTARNPTSVVMFLTNLYMFLAFWLVYFASGWTSWTRCQSLRTLLMIHSQQWSDPEFPGAASPDASVKIEVRREKAKSTMATQAIFIAVAVFIISAFAEDPSLAGDSKIRIVDHWVALIGLGAAMSSFTLILVSTDAAETMFNSFAKGREERAIYRLYSISARLKYYGFVLCFLSLALFVYTLDPAVAALSILFIILIGYAYWFPDASQASRHYREVLSFVLVVLATNLYVWSNVL